MSKRRRQNGQCGHKTTLTGDWYRCVGQDLGAWCPQPAWGEPGEQGAWLCSRCVPKNIQADDAILCTCCAKQVKLLVCNTCHVTMQHQGRVVPGWTDDGFQCPECQAGLEETKVSDSEAVVASSLMLLSSQPSPPWDWELVIQWPPATTAS